MNNKVLTLKYLKIAIHLDKNNKYKFINEMYDNLTKAKQENIKYDPLIKLLIYSFDETITYWNIDTNEMNINNMSRSNICKRIFGGKDRVQRLKMHFDRVLSSPNKISIIILSHHSTHLIVDTLHKIRFAKYLKYLNIIGNDNPNANTNTLQKIIELSNEYQLEKK
eukprot:464298_1